MSVLRRYPNETADVAMNNTNRDFWRAACTLLLVRIVLSTMAGAKMVLETELATYKHKLPELCGQEGKYALVHGADLVGVFGTYDDALAEGYKQFGLEPFLVKQIQAIEQVQCVSRFLNPAA